MSADDLGRRDAQAASDFGLGKTHPRSGSSVHHSGWQQAVPLAREAVPPPFGTEHAAPSAPAGRISHSPLAQRLQQRIDEHGRHDVTSANAATATPAAASGLAQSYARNGSSVHHAGWQETVPVTRDAVAPPFGSQHLAKPAPEGTLARTPLAERLRQRVADYEKK